MEPCGAVEPCRAVEPCGAVEPSQPQRVAIPNARNAARNVLFLPVSRALNFPTRGQFSQYQKKERIVAFGQSLWQLWQCITSVLVNALDQDDQSIKQKLFILPRKGYHGPKTGTQTGQNPCAWSRPLTVYQAGLLQKFSDRILQGSSFHTSHMILSNITLW